MTAPFLADVDISDWTGIAPSVLIEHPAFESSKRVLNATARAMKYARADGATLYDDVAFRHFAACPSGTDVPLRTIFHMRRERAQMEGSALYRELRRHLAQLDALRHRPLDIPHGVRMRTRVTGDLLEYRPFTPADKAAGPPEVWAFSASSPPVSFLQDAVDGRDAAPLLSQRMTADVPGMFWLPLPAVIASGTFRPMQQYGTALEHELVPGNFYAFVSHRWLTRAHPDPEGIQARLLCWQLFASLCEAIWIAGHRGLNTPRKFSRLLGFAIGARGSELAESMLVNVVRPALEESELDLWQQEIASIEALWLDRGVAASAGAASMQTLRQVLRDRPLLSTLMQRVFIWYDYSCMPQAPRTPQEQVQFLNGLKYLNGIQSLGRTVVLLDDVEDYVGRAWCTMESVLADIELSSVDLLVGAPRETVERGNVENHFLMLFEDRPHLIWRGILDTELFGVQTPLQCMARLGLAATDGADLPLLYQRLCGLRAPGKLHVTDTEVLTGAFALPLVAADAVALWERDALPLRLKDLATYPHFTLDWTGAFSPRHFAPANGQSDPATVAPHVTFERTSQSLAPIPRAHVAIIASCEGEAILLSSWADRRRDELEKMLEVEVVSRSWLASDVAPVGHFVCGDLWAKGIAAEMWVLVASTARFQYCPTTSLLLSVLNRAMRTTIGVLCDRRADNVLVLLPEPESSRNPSAPAPPALRSVPTSRLPVHRGGLFRMMLGEYLVPADTNS